MTIFGTDFQANDFGTDMEEKLFRGRGLHTKALYIKRNLWKHVRLDVMFLHIYAIVLQCLANRRWMSAPLSSRRESSVMIVLLFLASMMNEILARIYGPVLYPPFEFMYNVPRN